MSISAQTIADPDQSQRLDGNFLTFTLDHKEYGLEINGVQELRGDGAVTCIANTREYSKGFCCGPPGKSCNRSEYH